MPSLGDVFWGHATGRYRSIRLSAAGTGSNAVHLRPSSFNPETGEIDPGAQEAVKAFRSLLGPGPDPFNPPEMHFEAGPMRGMGWLAAVKNGIGATGVDDHRTDYVSPPAGVGDHTDVSDCEWSAEYAISRADEYFLLYFLNQGVRGADGDPTYGGPAVGDVSPRALGIYFYEVVPAGAAIAASISVSAPYGSASASCSSVNGQAWTLGYAATLNLTADGESTIGLSAHCTGKFGDGWQRCGPKDAVSFSNPYTSLSASGPSLSVTAIGPLASGHSMNGALSAEPDRCYRFKGQAYALDKAYPGSLDLSIFGSPPGEPQKVVLSPSGQADVTQRTWAVDYVLDGGGPVHLDGRAEWDALKAAIHGNREDPKDWVATIAGKPYSALTLAHAASHPEPTPARQGDGSWRHDYPPFPTSGNWEGYAFLRIVARTDHAGEVLTVLASGRPAKTYHVTTAADGALTTFDADLCAPVSPTPEESPELWDDRNPLCADGLPLKDPLTWGIGAVASLTISGGTNLVVQSVALVRKDPAARVASLVAFLDWSLVQNDESYHYGGVVGSVPIVQGSRGIVVDVDGRRSIVEPCSLRQLSTDASGNPLWVYSGRTARDFRASANACPGFTCAESYTPTDGWHALDGSEGANFITGGPIFYAGWSGFQATGGVYWRGYAPQNELGLAISDAPTKVLYQPRYHEVIGYPNMGDCWGDDGGYYDDGASDATRTPIRLAKVLRAAIDGVTYDPGGATIANATVAGGGSSGVTDVRGRYRMGPPYGPGQTDQTVTFGSASGDFSGDWDDGQGLGTTDTTQERWNALRWHRAVFRPLVQRAGGGVANLHTPNGRYWVADVVAGGIRVRTALNGGPVPGWRTTTIVPAGDGAANPCLTWDPNTSLGHLTWDESDGIHESYSKSMGKSWGDPALSAVIPGGRIARRRHAFPSGDAIEFAIVADGGSGAGKLVGAFRGRGDTAWSAPFDVTIHPSSSVDPGATFRLAGDASAPVADYDVFPGHTSDGRWSLTIRRVGDDEPSEWFSVERDARRFKPATS